MSWRQLVAPNPSIPVKPGWCLAFVQQAFRAPWAGSTATDGWNKAQAKHADQNFPNGVAVPVWFAMAGEPAGHVALRMADSSYYSTSHPTNTTPYHHPSLAHLMTYYGGRLTVRGWSEDLNGYRVIEQVKEEDVTTKEDLEKLWAGFLDRPVMDSEYKEFVGRPLELILNTVWSSSEFKTRMDGLRKMWQEAQAGKSDADKKLQAIKDALGIK